MYLIVDTRPEHRMCIKVHLVKTLDEALALWGEFLDEYDSDSGDVFVCIEDISDHSAFHTSYGANWVHKSHAMHVPATFHGHRIDRW